METLRHFTLIIAGENPEELIQKYDVHNEREPYIVYKISEADALHSMYIKSYEMMLENNGGDTIKEHLKFIKEMSDIEFFAYISDGYDFDEDGNAISTENPDGKYYTCRVGKNLSMPLKTKSGEEVFSALKKDIDWDSIHLSNYTIYDRVWDMVVNGDKPINDNEQVLYDNMKERKAYFSFFGDKDTYVMCNTAFWGYAFLSQETGWAEIDENVTQIKWVGEFFDRFIKPLDENTKISVYECTRLEDE